MEEMKKVVNGEDHNILHTN